ncbi:MAG TPA: hypothetical protein PKE62_11245 [Anaerolineales bacterium]|nr:hypothetical protein [Anaerolineales bacterium]
MKRLFGVLAVVAMSAVLVYLAYVIPSQLLGDTMSHQTVTPNQTDVTPTRAEVTPTARYSVTVEVLEVRSGAGESFPNVGYLRRGDLVTVYEIQSATGEACRQWARIGAEQWTCYDFLEVIP